MLARCCTNYASLFVDGWLMVEEMEENGMSVDDVDVIFFFFLRHVSGARKIQMRATFTWVFLRFPWSPNPKFEYFRILLQPLAYRQVNDVENSPS